MRRESYGWWKNLKSFMEGSFFLQLFLLVGITCTLELGGNVGERVELRGGQGGEKNCLR